MNPNDATAKKKFQEVQSAFEVLSDPDKRKRYDQFGSDFESMGGPGGPGGGGPRWRTANPGGQSYQFDMNDLGDLFGGGGAADTSQREPVVLRISSNNSAAVVAAAGGGLLLRARGAISSTISRFHLRLRYSVAKRR